MSIVDTISRDIDYFFFFYSFLFAGLTILWNVYFVKKILYFVNLYRKSIDSARNDILNNYTELALHYKVGIVKYAFLLAINITEISSAIIFLLGVGMTVVNSTNATISNCYSEIYNIDLYVITGTPMEAVFSSIGHAGFLMSLALVTCLMEYLDAAYHNINNQSLKSTKIILLISCVIGVLLIITGSIHQSYILERLIYPIVLLVYFSFWVRQTRIFYKTLEWQSIEYRVRGRSSQIVERAVKSSHHFAIIMCLMGIGVLSITLAQLINDYFFIFTIFAYCPNLVTQLYGTPDYEPLFTTTPQMNAFILSGEITLGIQTTLYLIAFLAITSQYVLATFVFFLGMFVKKIKYRFGRVRTRFTPSLTDPLLIS